MTHEGTVTPSHDEEGNGWALLHEMANLRTPGLSKKAELAAALLILDKSDGDPIVADARRINPNAF